MDESNACATATSRSGGYVPTVPSSPPDTWTAPEQRLWNAFLDGAILDLEGPNPTLGRNVSDLWGVERTVRASSIAHLLIDAPQRNPGKPPRLILKGALIEGTLDLGCSELGAFLFIECLFTEKPILNDGKASFVGFRHCAVPGLDAARLQCEGPVWIVSCHVFGGIDLEDANIVGDLSLGGSQLKPAANLDALVMDGASIGNDAVLSSCVVSNGIRMNGTQIGGWLNLNGAELDNAAGWALSASQLRVTGSITAGNKVNVVGGLNFQGARVEGAINFNEATIKRPRELALFLDHARVGLGLSLNDARLMGSVRMHHSIIDCQISLERTKITEVRGNALRADHIVVEGSVLWGNLEAEGPVDIHGAKIECNLVLTDARFSAEKADFAFGADRAYIGNHLLAGGCRSVGAFRLTSVKVDGNAYFSDAHLDNRKRVALDIRQAVVKGSLSTAGSFLAVGGVCLTATQVGVDLILTDSTISRVNGKAVHAEGLTVAGDVVADRCTVEGLFDLVGARVGGTVRLVDAKVVGAPLEESSRGKQVDNKGGWRGISFRGTGSKIAGDLDFKDAEFSREVVLDRAEVGHFVRIDGTRLDAEGSSFLRAESLTAGALILKPAKRPSHDISLASASVGELNDSEESWPLSGIINISGMRYGQLSGDIPVATRLAWLRRATEPFSAQPYEQLSAYFSSVGKDADARAVKLEAVRRSHHSARWPVRVWGSIQDFVIGYGFAPFRAVAIFVGFLALGAFWFAIGASDCSQAIAGLCPVKADEHPSWDPWLYSLDLLIPIVDLGHDKAWDPTGWSKLVMITLTVAGWVLTTTVIAAAGRTLRRP